MEYHCSSGISLDSARKRATANKHGKLPCLRSRVAGPAYEPGALLQLTLKGACGKEPLEDEQPESDSMSNFHAGVKERAPLHQAKPFGCGVTDFFAYCNGRFESVISVS